MGYLPGLRVHRDFFLLCSQGAESMSGPPEDISAKELYLNLTQSKPSEVFDFPRLDPETKKPLTTVRIVVLSQREHEIARVEAHKKIKQRYNLKEDDLGGDIMREVVGDATARELLALACVYEKPMAGPNGAPFYPKMFRDSDHVGDLSANEILLLFNCYLLTQEKHGPFERGFHTPDEMDRWIKRIEEGGAEFPLLSMPLPQLVTLTSLLGARMCSLFRDLATQWESLPDSLRSKLETYSADILSYGSARDEPAADGSENSPDDLLPGPSLSLEEAKDLAERIVRR